MTRPRTRNGGGVGLWLLPVLTALAGAVVLLLGLNAYSDLTERADRGRVERDVLAEDVRVLREQVEQLGETPEAPPPEERVDDAGDTVEIRGQRGLSCVEELGLDACKGPPGASIAGIPGPSCGEEFGFEACRGDPGIQGIQGIQGDQGVQGDQGDTGPSCVEELGLEACRGPDGVDGADGQDGSDGIDGRGIVSIEFVNGGDCRMVITYDRPDETGGTVQEIPGMPASMCKTEEPPPEE